MYEISNDVVCAISKGADQPTHECILIGGFASSLNIWASSRQNLSSGFPTKRVSNQSPQLQSLARKLKFHL